MYNFLNLLFLLFLFSSCTYNVSLVHTEGSASDIIDTDQRADPKTDLDLSIPTGAI